MSSKLADQIEFSPLDLMAAWPLDLLEAISFLHNDLNLLEKSVSVNCREAVTFGPTIVWMVLPRRTESLKEAPDRHVEPVELER